MEAVGVWILRRGRRGAARARFGVRGRRGFDGGGSGCRRRARDEDHMSGRDSGNGEDDCGDEGEGFHVEAGRAGIG